MIHANLDTGELAAKDADGRSQASAQLWQWVAGALLAVVVSAGTYCFGKGDTISAAEARQLVSGPVNPYVQDKAAIDQHLQSIDRKLETLDSMQHQLNRMCIKLGIDPEGPIAIYPRPRE